MKIEAVCLSVVAVLGPLVIGALAAMYLKLRYLRYQMDDLGVILKTAYDLLDDVYRQVRELRFFEKYVYDDNIDRLLDWAHEAKLEFPTLGTPQQPPELLVLKKIVASLPGDDLWSDH